MNDKLKYEAHLFKIIISLNDCIIDLNVILESSK